MSTATPASPAALVDAPARDQITDATGDTLFVNAGAGSGKTAALVDRVQTLVLRDGVPLARIAAVTFTERAGAELRDRLRAVFEKASYDAAQDPERHARAVDALDDLDGAAIGTLHSFAQRILSEHPIEAGLPPRLEILDEVASSVAFEDRWRQLRGGLLDDDSVAPALLMALDADIKLGSLRSLAHALGADWDLIGSHVLSGVPPILTTPDIAALVIRAREALLLCDECSDPTDKLLAASAPLAAAIDQAATLPVDQVMSWLKQIAGVKIGKTLGRKGSWARPKEEVRQAWQNVVEEADALHTRAVDAALRILVRWLAERVRHEAELRRDEGRLEFHDLLVLTRDLLRDSAETRAALHRKYRRLLLDEFQDTDPIQIELAVRIAAGAEGSAPDWREVRVPAGRLFVVGDAKQSIYRFRRADIATYLRTRAVLGTSVELSTNFRTVPAVLDWVNAVFGSLIRYIPGQQPPYEALSPFRPAGGRGPAVLVLGAEEHAEKLNAARLRRAEAADVAAAIRQALDTPWDVWDERSKRWRAARAHDIAVLVPARTSLPHLEDALDAARIPYRAESSSLVYQADEVRALLATARAIADPADELSLVTALRSSAFGCGDDDLFRWRRAGGRFRLRARPPEDADAAVANGPVAQGLAYLADLSRRARWMSASEVLTAILTERRAFETAALRPRHRDTWRRLRFVVDQARAWSEASPGGLRAYLDWAAFQGNEATRVAEAVLPEKDVDAVRVMTVHAAKGLEFPIVVMSGMTAQPRTQRGVRLLWTETGYEARFSSAIQTGDFKTALPLDEQMDEQERLRLLYVAATRARDHLVVSLHRFGGTRSSALLLAGAGAADAAEARLAPSEPAQAEGSPPGARADPPPPHAEWTAWRERAQAASRAISAVTASGLEGTEPEVVLGSQEEPGLAKGPRDLSLPPWSKGRYGSEVGRAVHGVLQNLPLDTPADDPTVGEAAAAQCVAEGVAGQEALVTALVASALRSPLVRAAAAREHWRETYVATVGADGVVIEGYIDLLYRDDDGALVVVDYKTDAIPEGALPSRVTYYTPQLQAYRRCVADATQTEVRSTLLFLHPQADAVEAPVPG